MKGVPAFLPVALAILAVSVSADQWPDPAACHLRCNPDGSCGQGQWCDTSFEQPWCECEDINDKCHGDDGCKPISEPPTCGKACRVWQVNGEEIVQDCAENSTCIKGTCTCDQGYACAAEVNYLSPGFQAPETFKEPSTCDKKCGTLPSEVYETMMVFYCKEGHNCVNEMCECPDGQKCVERECVVDPDAEASPTPTPPTTVPAHHVGLPVDLLP